jgi:hypothetical protein
MPTEVKSYVGSSSSWTALSASDKAYYTDTGGSNYTTPQLWDDDYGNTTGDLVADDEIAIAELNAEDFIGQLIIRNEWTTDTTRYPVIRARVGSEYNHVTDTGAKIYRNANRGIDIYAPYTRLERVRIGSDSYRFPVYALNDNTVDLRGCTILSSASVSTRNQTGLYFRSCVLKMLQSYNGTRIQYVNLRNCTIITGGNHGLIVRDGTAYNTVIHNAVTNTTWNLFYSVDAGDYNAQSESFDAAPPGANSIIDLPKTAFNDFDNGDYSLSGITSELYHTGSSTYAPDLDNNGVAFNALTPSIGAFEFFVPVVLDPIEVTKNNGTTIGISSSLPTTFDADSGTGYPSLTFTDIGEVLEIGEITKTYKAINFKTTSRLFPQKIKDTFDISNVPLTLGRVSANTGQVEIQSALMSYASVSFEVVLPSGDIGNFTGKVMKAGLATISYGSISTTLVDISIDANTLFET